MPLIHRLYLILMVLAVSAVSAQADEEADAGEQPQLDGNTFRLFSPLVYDPAVAAKAFTLGTDSLSLTDKILLDTYLKHPRLVRSSGSMLFPTMQDDIIDAPGEQAEWQAETIRKHGVHAAPAEIIQNDEPIELFIAKPHFWTFSGDYNLQFMHNYISPNWYKSGNSSYSMLGNVTMQYNYNNKQRLKWDNKLELKLGFQNTDADTINRFKTTEDLIRYTSQLSLQAYKRWYYAAQVIASTQFTRGLKNNDSAIYSDFMSPFNLNLSFGMNYNVEAFNKKLTGNILLAPASYKMTYVDRPDLATRFGVKEGKQVRNDIGSLIDAELVWKPLDNFKWQTRLYSFTTYHFFQLEWENTFTFQFNRFISANLFVYPRFDDTVEKTTDTYWQLKEYLSVGFTYSM